MHFRSAVKLIHEKKKTCIRGRYVCICFFVGERASNHEILGSYYYTYKRNCGLIKRRFFGTNAGVTDTNNIYLETGAKCRDSKHAEHARGLTGFRISRNCGDRLFVDRFAVDTGTILFAFEVFICFGLSFL